MTIITQGLLSTEDSIKIIKATMTNGSMGHIMRNAVFGINVFKT